MSKNNKINQTVYKTISPISLLITSLLIIILGVIMLFNPVKIENLIKTTLPFIIICIGLLNIIAHIFGKNKKQNNKLITGILYIFLGILVKYNIIFVETSIVFIIGLYAFINVIAQLISTIILYNNRTKEWKYSFISTITSLAFGLILVINPSSQRLLVSKLAGIYLIFIGLTIFRDFLLETFDIKSIKPSLKRKIRIRLPVIYTAFIPQKLLEKMNALMQSNDEKVFVQSKNDQKGELEIFVHIAKKRSKWFWTCRYMLQKRNVHIWNL